MSISSDDPRNVDEGEILTGNLDNLIGRISGPPMSEIDCLVSDLQAWRQHIEYEGERVQRTIAEFAQLKQASASAIAEAIEEMKRALRTGMSNCRAILGGNAMGITGLRPRVVRGPAGPKRRGRGGGQTG